MLLGLLQAKSNNKRKKTRERLRFPEITFLSEMAQTIKLRNEKLNWTAF